MKQIGNVCRVTHSCAEQKPVQNLCKVLFANNIRVMLQMKFMDSVATIFMSPIYADMQMWELLQSSE